MNDKGLPVSYANMAYLAFCIAFIGGMSAGTYLVIHGHPWFAILVFLITGSISVTHKSSDSSEDKV